MDINGTSRKWWKWSVWVVMTVAVILNCRMLFSQGELTWQSEWDEQAPWLVPGRVWEQADDFDFYGDNRYYITADPKDVQDMLQRVGFEKLEKSGPLYDEFREPLYYSHCKDGEPFEEFTPFEGDIYHTPKAVHIPGQGNYRLYITLDRLDIDDFFYVMRVPSAERGEPLPLAHPGELSFHQLLEGLTLPMWLHSTVKVVQIILAVFGMHLIFNGFMLLRGWKMEGIKEMLWYYLPIFGWFGNLFCVLYESEHIREIPGHPDQVYVWLTAIGGTVAACIFSPIVSAILAKRMVRKAPVA